MYQHEIYIITNLKMYLSRWQFGRKPENIGGAGDISGINAETL